MKKETHHIPHDNSFGVASVVFGIFSILFSSPPLYGIVLSVIALIFARKQRVAYPNRWSKNGTILAVIGLILSVIFFVVLIWLSENPEILSQLSQIQ